MAQASGAASPSEQVSTAADEPASRAPVSAHADLHDELEDGGEDHSSDDSDACSSASGSALSDGGCEYGYENEPAFESAAGGGTRRCDATLRVRVHAARV